MATSEALGQTHGAECIVGDTADVPDSHERGWYLYGLTRMSAALGDTLTGLPELEGDFVCWLQAGQLAAVVRRVPVAEFSGEALRAHVQDMAWLEAMVRHHHQVLDLLHRRQVVLPCKFGCVYLSARDVEHALVQAHDALLAQIEHVAGCDEWGVHLTMTRAALDQLAQQHDAAIQALHQDVATMSPGRAYLLRRRLADARSAARERVADALACEAYHDLIGLARSGSLSTTPDIPAGGTDGTEETDTVMRAVFLVPRSGAEAFLTQGQRCAARIAGLRCTYSGPWPPYSFATLPGGDRDE